MCHHRVQADQPVAGQKATLRTREMICWYFFGMAKEVELLAHPGPTEESVRASKTDHLNSRGTPSASPVPRHAAPTKTPRAAQLHFRSNSCQLSAAKTSLSVTIPLS